MASIGSAFLTLNRFPSLCSFTHTRFNHFTATLFFLSSNTPIQRRRFNSCTKVTMASHTITTSPYGSWKSPITADVVSGASKRLGGTAVDGRGRLIWLESRPTESG